jgi:hypothetical protein
METKRYAVVLSEAGAAEVSPFAGLWMRQSNGVSYFNCKSIEPNAAYFRMVLEEFLPDGKTFDFELQIPHAFVRGVLYAADLKHVGFKTAP